MTKQEILEYFNDINHAYNESTRLDDLSLMLDELMRSNSDGDCISRADAIKAIRNYNVTIEVSRAIGKSQLADIVDSINKVQEKMISELPSIQPKAKMGYWIYRVVGIYRYASCSECNKMQVDESNYCPNCGVKMESEDKK